MHPLAKTALVPVLIVAGTLLAPGSTHNIPATARSVQAGTPVCTPDNCDSLLEYYSDATYTVRVGEYEDGPCGQTDTGVHTQYVKRFWRTC